MTMAARVDGVNLRMNNQFIHHGVTMQLDADLVARIQGRSPGPLTYGQAVEYQIVRDQDVALTAYLADSSGAQGTDSGPA